MTSLDLQTLDSDRLDIFPKLSNCVIYLENYTQITLRKSRLPTNGCCLLELEEEVERFTHGTVNSKMLLSVCLSSMMTAIWMKRSVRQPLGWH